MESFTTQFLVRTKSEAMADGLKFTVDLVADSDAGDVTGEMRIVVTDPDVRALFQTNEVFDVVLTPRDG